MAHFYRFAEARLKTEAAVCARRCSLEQDDIRPEYSSRGRDIIQAEMQHDDAGRGPGAGLGAGLLLLPGSSIPRHRSTCSRRAAPPLVKHYPCNTSPSPAFLTHTQIKHSALKKLIISIQFPCSEGVACSDPAADLSSNVFTIGIFPPENAASRAPALSPHCRMSTLHSGTTRTYWAKIKKEI